MIRAQIFVLISLLLCWLAGPALAQTHAPHEHGAAALNLAIEDDGFAVEIDGALAGFISFEHEPSTDAQKAEVKEMAAKFAKADEMFKAPAAAGCKVASIALKSAHLPADLLAPYAAAPGGHGHGSGPNEADHHHDDGDHDHGEAEHGHGHDEGDHEHDHGEHADLEAELDFKCDNAGALDSLALDGFFASFPLLEELEAQIVSPKGQSAAELTKGSAVAKW